MIKIRYADLPGGLHVRVAASGKDTIIYLLPGLTTVQRRAALRRARSSARMGHGPGLPSAGVASAVAADGVRTTLRNVAGAMRIHPGIFFPPIVIISFAAVAYILLVSVTAQVHPPQAGGPGGPGNPIPQAVAPPPGSPVQAPMPRRTAPAPARSARPRPTSTGRGHHPAGPSPSASPRPSATAPAEPSPSPTPIQPVPTASPSPDPNPGGIVSGGSGLTSSELCLHLGPLGTCLSIPVR